jgi:hypothetical protein
MYGERLYVLTYFIFFYWNNKVRAKTDKEVLCAAS